MRPNKTEPQEAGSRHAADRTDSPAGTGKVGSAVCTEAGMSTRGQSDGDGIVHTNETQGISGQTVHMFQVEELSGNDCALPPHFDVALVRKSAENFQCLVGHGEVNDERSG